MEEEGVLFECNANVGVNVNINSLLRENNAVVLALGSTIPRGLDIPGNEFKGVHFAMDFLKQQNKRVSHIAFEGNEINASGKHVVVIGGGDTGSDCIGTSARQNAASILQLELLPMPPEARNEMMPWPNYPMLLKTTSSHEEGAARQWAVATKEFIGDGQGNLRAIKIVDLEWQSGKEGLPAQFKEIAGTEREISCELVLLAMGFVHPQHEGVLKALEVELDARGNVKASEQAYQTSLAKVFAAGDVRRGQSLVVWAISEGRECARRVDEYLMGSSALAANDYSSFQANAVY